MADDLGQSGQAKDDALYRLMVERIPGVVWSTDCQLRFTTAFGAGLAALGLEPGEVVGTTLYELFQTEDEDFAPPIARHANELAEAFTMPGVPSRIEDRLVETIKRCLSDLRTVGRYTERDRVLALSGLLAARVLGVRLPRAPSGRTYFEEYDALMRQHGRRPEFEGS